MHLHSLDQEKRLWSISHLLTDDWVNAIVNFDWINAKHEQGNLSNRRQITVTGEVEKFEKQMLNLLPEINQQLGTAFTSMFGQWWLDLEGFSCDLHTDGQLPNAMQIYWIAPGPGYGTAFYHYKRPDQLKHQFLSVANTGYVMLNHLEPNGSQPLQWHAMLNQLEPGMIRLSSYHIFDL